jgi:hypothetical protein
MEILLFNVLLVATCGYALLRGGGPEQVAAIMLFCAAMATLALNLTAPLSFRGLEIGVLAIDLLLLVGLIALSLCADRFWTLWITAFHASAVAVHLVRMTNPQLLPFVYLVAAGLMSIPMQLVLAWATRRHQTRMIANGTDNSWADFWPLPIRHKEPIGRRS